MAKIDLYSVNQAAKLIGISKVSIRAYTAKEEYQRHLSTEATPAPGKERRFTPDDLRLFRFVANHTSQGETHEQITERLTAGELSDFKWTPPDLTEPSEQNQAQETQLVPYERLQAAHALLADARQREENIADQLREAQEKIERLTLELGQAQGERDAMRRRRPAWWVRLFGE